MANGIRRKLHSHVGPHAGGPLNYILPYSIRLNWPLAEPISDFRLGCAPGLARAGQRPKQEAGRHKAGAAQKGVSHSVESCCVSGSPRGRTRRRCASRALREEAFSACGQAARLRRRGWRRKAPGGGAGKARAGAVQAPPRGGAPPPRGPPSPPSPSHCSQRPCA